MGGNGERGSYLIPLESTPVPHTLQSGALATDQPETCTENKDSDRQTRPFSADIDWNGPTGPYLDFQVTDHDSPHVQMHHTPGNQNSCPTGSFIVETPGSMGDLGHVEDSSLKLPKNTDFEETITYGIDAEPKSRSQDEYDEFMSELSEGASVEAGGDTFPSELGNLVTSFGALTLSTEPQGTNSTGNVCESVETQGDATVQAVRHFTIPDSCQLCLLVPITIGQRIIPAVVDTGAETTVISSDTIKELGELKCSGNGAAKLRYAGKHTESEGLYWKQVDFQLGERRYVHDIVEADISDPMILGMDFMRGRLSAINLLDGRLEMMDGEHISASMRRDNSLTGRYVSRLLVGKNTVVPPGVVMTIPVTMEYPAETTFMVEPKADTFDSLLVIPGVVSGDQHLQIWVANVSDHNAELKLRHCPSH